MKVDMQRVIVEGLKDMLRIIWLAVIPVIYAGINVQTGEVKINWQIVGAVALLAVLKAIDKSIHTVGKELQERGEWGNVFMKGLTRF